MRIVISSGHGKYIRGASDIIDEVDEARRVTETVADFLRSLGVEVKTFHDDTSDSQDENLRTIVNYHNAQTRDLDVSVHFNAYQHTTKPMGTEVLYVTQSSKASQLSLAIADAGDFINRGGKYRSDLYFLNNTEMPALLLEICFVDSTVDTDLYHRHYDAICEAIAETLSGRQVPEEPTVPPPEEVVENRLVITGEAIGNVTLVLNGQTFVKGTGAGKVTMTLETEGEVLVTINGEDYHNIEALPPGPAENHTDIETTVFGGASDPNNSAYPPYGYLNDTDLYVALPYSFPSNLFPNNPPKVRVYHGELSAVGAVADKGPWTTDDEAYVMGTARPIAETCHDEGSPLPSGPNAGKVPSNAAGLDLSPALASKVGLEGKGRCDWEFVEENVV